MKKTAILLTVFVMLMSMFVMPVSAETVMEYRLSTVSLPEGGKIAAGEEFSVQVSVSAVESTAMVEYKFRYDKTLMEPVSSTVEGFLNTFFLKEVNIAPVRNDNPSETYGEVWITGMGETNVSAAEDEVIATVTFKALADIIDDTPMVAYYADMTDMAFAPFTCNTVDGGVVIGEKNEGEIPAEMLAPADNAAPTTAAGGASDEEKENKGGGSVIVIVIVGVLAVAGLAAVLIINKKK